MINGFAMHPLAEKRKPGPKTDQRPGGEADFERAARILELVDCGKLTAKPVEASCPIACDSSGRPLEKLTREDEHALATRIQASGDVEARNMLVLGNLGLVHMVAQQLKRDGIRYDDLVQEGTLGLMRATESFDPTHGVRFSTYCVYWIRAKVHRFLQKIDRDDVPLVVGAKVETTATGQRRRPRQRKAHFEQPLRKGEGQTLADVVPHVFDTPEETTLRREQREHMRSALADINAELDDDRMSLIIEERLLSDSPKTLSSLSQVLKISRERTRQLEGKLIELAHTRLSPLGLV